ncbi:MAG: metallophosphoesterase family protein [Limisphaerales bacterium]
MPTPRFPRRQFLPLLAGSLTLPLTQVALGNPKPLRPLKIGILADLHQDIIHDAPKRLSTFVQWATEEQCPAIIQLGDFCIPKPENRPLLDIWNSFKGPTLHVLGNHDMDGGFSREHTVQYLGLPHRHYTFDLNGWKCIVLDANDTPPNHPGGYPSYIANDQKEWLRQQLTASNLPTLIFSHQSLAHPACIKNQQEIRNILATAQSPDGKRKVAACFNGHWHIDHSQWIDSIPYTHINSASYYWMGDAYAKKRFAPAIHAQRPSLERVAPYSDPLFALLQYSPSTNELILSGRTTTWIGPSPSDSGLDPASHQCQPEWITPEIRNRSLPAT